MRIDDLHDIISFSKISTDEYLKVLQEDMRAEEEALENTYDPRDFSLLQIPKPNVRQMTDRLLDHALGYMSAVNWLLDFPEFAADSEKILPAVRHEAQELAAKYIDYINQNTRWFEHTTLTQEDVGPVYEKSDQGICPEDYGVCEIEDESEEELEDGYIR